MPEQNQPNLPIHPEDISVPEEQKESYERTSRIFSKLMVRIPQGIGIIRTIWMAGLVLLVVIFALIQLTSKAPATSPAPTPTESPSQSAPHN